jgi:hypothetical protein
MQFLYGFSEERSSYCQATKYLKLYGWVLSPKIDKIVIISKNKEITQTTLTINREDIWDAYNKIGSKKCGWSIETDVENMSLNDLHIYYFFEDRCYFTQQLFLKANQEKFTYINNLPITTKPIDIDQKNVLEQLTQQLNQYHTADKLTSFTLNTTDYFQWFETIDYKTNYPNYYNLFPTEENLHAKAIEHYLSLEILNITKDDIYLDVASSNSVCPDIVKKTYHNKVFKQDIQYKDGVDGDTIGSNATTIPLPDNTLTKLSLHCSLEHFEDNADIAFLKEAHRIMKKGAKIIITPLYLATKPTILTSPSIWEKKYIGVTKLPRFSKNYAILFDETIKQRQSKFFSPDTLLQEVILPFSVQFDFQILSMQNPNHKKLPFYPKFTLVLTKL